MAGEDERRPEDGGNDGDVGGWTRSTERERDDEVGSASKGPHGHGEWREKGSKEAYLGNGLKDDGRRQRRSRAAKRRGGGALGRAEKQGRRRRKRREGEGGVAGRKWRLREERERGEFTQDKTKFKWRKWGG